MSYIESNKRKSRLVLSAEYPAAFSDWLRSGGTTESAALYGGTGTAGGYALPTTTVAGEIVPFAPPDSAIRRLATIIPTEGDLLFPVRASITPAALKPESGMTLATFAVASSIIGQFKLSAFTVGVQDVVSMEFARDLPLFTTFVSQDAILGLDAVEETLYLNGSGIGQAQGMLGNVGPGVTGAVADENGSMLSVDSTYDVLGTLRSVYHTNASWLMQRATAVSLRRANRAAGGEPIFTRIGGQEYLHGYPIFFSAAMPGIAPGNTPVLFGDFAMGYLIGERGAPGVYLKVLDQLQILQGSLPVLVHRRTDGRVRRPEAIQGITLHA